MQIIKCCDDFGQPLKYLYQWDTERSINIMDIEISAGIELHFCNVDSDDALIITPQIANGGFKAIIPDELLQRDVPIMIYVVDTNGASSQTIGAVRITVVPRPKPADYVYTPTEQLTIQELDERIKSLEENQSGTDPDAIQQAVDAYMAKNPVTAGETDPTVPAWAKQATKPSYTAAEVGALPDTVAIPVVPSALPNPHKLTIKGAIQAEYDGSEAVTVTIPEGGRDGDYISTPTTAEIGQTIVVKAVDENGKPTEWEAANMVSGGGSLTADDWVKIATVSFAKDNEVVQHIITTDENGNAFSYDEILIKVSSQDYGGNLKVWFNTETLVSTDFVTLKNFFTFGSSPFAIIKRLVDKQYYVLSSTSDMLIFTTASKFETTKGKIQLVSLSREVTTNKGTIVVYGRSYK